MADHLANVAMDCSSSRTVTRCADPRYQQRLQLWQELEDPD